MNAKEKPLDAGVDEDDFSVVSALSNQSQSHHSATDTSLALRRGSLSSFHSILDSVSGSEGASLGDDVDSDAVDSNLQRLFRTPVNKDRAGSSQSVASGETDNTCKESSLDDDESNASIVSSRSERSRTYDPSRVSELVARSRARNGSKKLVRRSSSSSLLPLPTALQ
jgi:hypothetical protein